MLEEEVDEKYYLSKEIQDRLTITDPTFSKSVIGTTAPDFRTIGQRDLVYQKNGVMGTLTATDYKQPKQICTIVEPKIEQVGNIDLGNNESNNRVYSPDGLFPTLNTMQGGHRQPKIIEPMICASRGRNPENPSSRVAGEPTEQRIEINTSGCSNTLTTVQKDNYVIEPLKYPCMNKNGYKLAYDGDGIVTQRPNKARSTVISQCSFSVTAQNRSDNGVCLIQNNKYAIRKLTPRECWRLMGFQDKYFDRVHGVSNAQLYKQAGNSIVVDVLRAIFRELKNQYPFEFEEDDL